jgi:hypothetical protein
MATKIASSQSPCVSTVAAPKPPVAENYESTWAYAYRLGNLVGACTDIARRSSISITGDYPLDPDLAPAQSLQQYLDNLSIRVEYLQGLLMRVDGSLGEA